MSWPLLQLLFVRPEKAEKLVNGGQVESNIKMGISCPSSSLKAKVKVMVYAETEKKRSSKNVSQIDLGKQILSLQ